MIMSIATAPKENRPMVHLSMEQNLFERISELIDPDKPVEVYRNLHKKCWSVRQSGKVKLHTDYICLKNAEFKVSQKGRERVLKEKRKNVHAFVKGFIVDPSEINKIDDYENPNWTDVTYNPYKCGSFVTYFEREVQFADYVDMCIGVSNPVMVIEGEK
jgi:hypothetical protein|tara:strand:+ start:616 stop:1092 length:477 start_codon:yes stop_codon:yes gene_type:complete